MLQLQNYINSSVNLQKRDLSRVRRNLLFFPTRKLIKSVSQSKPKCLIEETIANQGQLASKARNRYEQLMKIIRAPTSIQMKTPLSSAQEDRMRMVNFVNFKNNWKPQLASIERYSLKKNEEQAEKNEISKTLEPTKIKEYNQNQIVRKRTKITGFQGLRISSSHIEPKNTILKRILDLSNKHERELVNSRNQADNAPLNSKKQTRQEGSSQALQAITKQYGLKPIKSSNRLGRNQKISQLKTNSRQNIAGWTIKQFMS